MTTLLFDCLDLASSVLRKTAETFAGFTQKVTISIVCWCEHLKVVKKTHLPLFHYLHDFFCCCSCFCFSLGSLSCFSVFIPLHLSIFCTFPRRPNVITDSWVFLKERQFNFTRGSLLKSRFRIKSNIKIHPFQLAVKIGNVALLKHCNKQRQQQKAKETLWHSSLTFPFFQFLFLRHRSILLHPDCSSSFCCSSSHVTHLCTSSVPRHPVTSLSFWAPQPADAASAVGLCAPPCALHSVVLSTLNNKGEGEEESTKRQKKNVDRYFF